MTESTLTALALICSLKPSPAPSSSQLIAEHLQAELGKHGVTGETVRCVDHDILPGVEKDMGDGDQWPAIREKVLAADILVFSTPTWMGHMSSVAQRVLERLDSEIYETDDEGRPILLGKVAVVTVVGNEDGAHHIVAEAFQALNDVGFSIPRPRRGSGEHRIGHRGGGTQRRAPGPRPEDFPVPAVPVLSPDPPRNSG